jgi:hypothetical protein
VEEVFRRAECSDNLQRLALAIMLYQIEHGEMPDENWATVLKTTDGRPQSAEYFRCPSHPELPEGMTTYALIQYGDTVPGSLLLVELEKPVPLDKAVISVDEAIELMRSSHMEMVRRACCGRVSWSYERVGGIRVHPGGTNAAYRNGAVRFLALWNIEESELLRLLGRE